MFKVRASIECCTSYRTANESVVSGAAQLARVLHHTANWEYGTVATLRLPWPPDPFRFRICEGMTGIHVQNGRG